MRLERVQVVGLKRAIAAIKNSYNIGPINTDVLEVSERELEVAKKLGSDSTICQSHDAFLAGIIVNFDICFEEVKEDSLLKKLLTAKFFTISEFKDNKWHVNTNYRALKHFIKKYPEEEAFCEFCNDQLELFQELTNKVERK